MTMHRVEVRTPALLRMADYPSFEAMQEAAASLEEKSMVVYVEAADHEDAVRKAKTLSMEIDTARGPLLF